MRAVQDAVATWAEGRLVPTDCDRLVAEGRAGFARLLDVDAVDVAVGHQVSPFVGLVAAALPARARVLVAEGDFTSLLFPLLAQEPRGVEVRAVPLEALPEAIGADTDLVAVSAVQSADGRVADLDGLAAAAAHHGAMTLIDVTQSCGWLPVAGAGFDVVVGGGYKWLRQPRGTAFCFVAPAARERLVAHTAGWYASDTPWSDCYGLPLRQGAGAKRFDVSPAWLLWHAVPPAFAALEADGIEAIHAHDTGLADRLRSELGLAPAGSAIVALDLDAATVARVGAAGIACATRAGRTRFGFHHYNDEDDLDRLIGALRGS